MAKIRGELSKKNPYYISKYRYYELKYKCLQFNEWKEELNSFDLFGRSSGYIRERVDSSDISDRTKEFAIRRFVLEANVRMVLEALEALRDDLRPVIFDAVTKGMGWSVLQARYSLTCTRDEYYNEYHRFFYILSNLA